MKTYLATANSQYKILPISLEVGHDLNYEHRIVWS